jgi:hypothetical protein
LLQQIKLEHSEMVFLAGIELGFQVVLALLSRFPILVRGAKVNGVSVSAPSCNEINIHTKEPTWIKEHLEKPDVTGMDEEASMKLDSFKTTFNPSTLPLLRQFRPALVLIGQMDSARTGRNFYLLAYTIKTAAYGSRSQSMTLKNVWHYHSIDHPELFAKAAVWVWSGEVSIAVHTQFHAA